MKTNYLIMSLGLSLMFSSCTSSSTKTIKRMGEIENPKSFAVVIPALKENNYSSKDWTQWQVGIAQIMCDSIIQSYSPCVVLVDSSRIKPSVDEKTSLQIELETLKPSHVLAHNLIKYSSYYDATYKFSEQLYDWNKKTLLWSGETETWVYRMDYGDGYKSKTVNAILEEIRSKNAGNTERQRQ